jgi:hypothetical protein
MHLDLNTIIGRLTKSELLASVPLTTFTAKETRNWGNLLGAIQEKDSGIKTLIYQAAITKETRLTGDDKIGRKRRLEKEFESRRSRQWQPRGTLV